MTNKSNLVTVPQNNYSEELDREQRFISLIQATIKAAIGTSIMRFELLKQKQVCSHVVWSLDIEMVANDSLKFDSAKIFQNT